MKFFDKIKQTICLKVLSLLGYLITFYTIYWDFFYQISTEEEPKMQESYISPDDPLLGGYDFGNTSRPASTSSSQDYDLEDIFKMLGN